MVMAFVFVSEAYWAMAQWKAQVSLQVALNIFSKSPAAIGQVVPLLRHSGLPRTNNDLEHIFGQWRHHQRRCTGRCIGITHSGDSARCSWLLPLRLNFRLPAQVLCLFLGLLGSRSALNSKYQQQRVQQRQFRRSPTTYLASLEQKLLQLVLPPRKEHLLNKSTC